MVRLGCLAMLPPMILLGSCISHPPGRISHPRENAGLEPVLDQAQLVYSGGLSARTLPGYSFWQSFTPSISGELVQIDIGFFNEMCGNGTLALYAGEGTNGALLCSTPVAVVSGEAAVVNWNYYSVSSMVTEGQKYTFHFVPNPLTLPDPYGVCVGAEASLYTRGVFTHVDPSGECVFSSQSVFRTRVIPSNQPNMNVDACKSTRADTD